MKGGMSMKSPWRTVQMFISAQAAGIFEVEVDTDTKKTRCNCPVWKKNATCKHVKFVDNKMKLNNGHYSILVPNEVPEELAVQASNDPKKFREFVLNHAKIEVI
jgi:hypothetical protein